MDRPFIETAHIAETAETAQTVRLRPALALRRPLIGIALIAICAGPAGIIGARGTGSNDRVVARAVVAPPIDGVAAGDRSAHDRQLIDESAAGDRSALDGPTTGLAAAGARPAQDEPPTKASPIAYLPLAIEGVDVSDLRQPWPRVYPVGELASTSLLTTRGRTLTIGGVAGPPRVIMAAHPLSSRSRSRLEMDPAKLDHLLDASPEGIEYVFMRYEGTEAAFDAFEAAVDDRLDARADGEAWRERIHFVPQSVEALERADAPLARLMMDWGGYGAPLTARWEDASGAGELISESEGSGEWLPPITSVDIDGVPMAVYGAAGDPAGTSLACMDASGEPVPPSADIAGKVALIERGACPFYDKVVSAAHFGAVAAVIYSDDRPKVAMGCAAPSPCDVSPGIPAVMIERAAGLALSERMMGGVEVLASFTPLLIGADSLLIDHLGRPRETGSMPYSFAPTDPLQNIVWEADWLAYERDLDARLGAEADVVEIPVFEHVWASDLGWAGVRSTADIVLPDAETMATFDRLEVELTMSCVDRIDDNCGAWDYLVHMYLCDAPDDERCGLEIGRWITAYRREGRWVTDITPVLPHLLEGRRQRIQFWTVQNYALDMNFRLIRSDLPDAPREVVPLFTGGTFDARYNDGYVPIDFMVPEWAERVELSVLLTGHGFGKDTLNCAEFCNHTHHFAVNGVEYVKEHPEGASIEANFFVCAAKVREGVVPNQYGSWAYGRAGWCPGQDVPPWRVDITSSITRGVTNTITYQGLLAGEPYVPDIFAGETLDARIDMQSSLVFYGAKWEEGGGSDAAGRRVGRPRSGRPIDARQPAITAATE